MRRHAAPHRLIGERTGGGRGLIWLLVPLSVVGFAMTTINFDGPNDFGDRKETPKTVAEVKDRYEISVGTVMLDLRQLPDSGSVKTAAKTSQR